MIKFLCLCVAMIIISCDCNDYQCNNDMQNPQINNADNQTHNPQDIKTKNNKQLNKTTETSDILSWYLYVIYFSVLLLGLLMREIYDYGYKFVAEIYDGYTDGGCNHIYTKNKKLSYYNRIILPFRKKYPRIRTLFTVMYFVPYIQIAFLVIEFLKFLIIAGIAWLSYFFFNKQLKK